MDAYIAFISWLLWIMQWMWECRYFFNIEISFPLDIYPEVGFLDHMVVLFLIFHTVFHTGCTSLHFHQKCIRAFFFPHPQWQLLPFVFLIIAILSGGRWYLTMVLICISLMTGDNKLHFMYLLTIYMPLEKSLLRSRSHFKSDYLIIILFSFLLLSGMSCLYTFYTNCLLDT